MESFAAEDFDPHHARVLVVGPMSAGKTTLVHSLCHVGVSGAALRKRPPPTVGCNVDVKLLPGGPVNRSVEFWDVGGNPDAAPARRMFFENSAVAGVLLVYDMSNSRSVGELRAWVTELDAAGIPVACGEKAGTDFFGRGGGGGGSGSGGQGASTHGERGRGIALPDGRQADDTYMNTDLEGGSRATTGGRVPVLIVGNKEDVGESMRVAGSSLASELGAGHVSVCARKPEKLERFDRFFDEVLRHHSGQQAPYQGGEQHAWDVKGIEDQETWAPMTAIQNGRPDAARDRPTDRWEKPTGSGTRRGVTVEPTASKSWGRAGSASSSSRDHIETTGRAGGTGAGIPAGKKWPAYPGVVGAGAGARRSREKQC